MWELEARRSPLCPLKCARTEPQDRCLGSNWSHAFSTSNSDVTLGAFSKWFKYLHPLSAAEGMLNQRALRPERMARDSSESGNIALDNNSSQVFFFLGHNITQSPLTINRSIRVTRKGQKSSERGITRTISCHRNWAWSRRKLAN